MLGGCSIGEMVFGGVGCYFGILNGVDVRGWLMHIYYYGWLRIARLDLTISCGQANCILMCLKIDWMRDERFPKSKRFRCQRGT